MIQRQVQATAWADTEADADAKTVQRHMQGLVQKQMTRTRAGIRTIAQTQMQGLVHMNMHILVQMQVQRLVHMHIQVLVHIKQHGLIQMQMQVQGRYKGICRGWYRYTVEDWYKYRHTDWHRFRCRWWYTSSRG